MERAICATIKLDLENHTGLRFRITNKDHFLEVFGNPNKDIWMFDELDDHGHQVTKNIKEILLQAVKDKEIDICISPSYSDEGMAIFDFVEMREDEFGALILCYEFSCTAS